MKVFLIRHAEAEPGEPDELRPLTPDGRLAARRLGDALVERHVDAVVSSPLLRACETAEAIARAVGIEARADDGLRPGATVETLLAAVTGRGTCVAAIAHQPDCSEIVAELTGESRSFAPADHVELEL